MIMTTALTPREKAHKVAEAALHDMREMLPPDELEDGYDLFEQPDGGILIVCGHDVKLYVGPDGEEGSVPAELLFHDTEPLW